MDLAADYKILRTMLPFVVDGDWVLLGQVPAWVEPVHSAEFASLECRVVAREFNMVPVSGTCTIQVVQITDAGVTLASAHSVTYGVAWVTPIPALFALRVSAASNAPKRLTITGRGL